MARRHARRQISLRAGIAVPVAAYFVTMVVLAVFVVHPPLIGWIGLGLATLVGLLAGAAAVRLWPRLGVNSAQPRRRLDGVYRLLVVVDADAETDAVEAAVLPRLAGRPAEVRVVAPVVPTLTDFLTGDEHVEEGDADRRLAAALRAIASLTTHVSGTVGADDPLQAAGDALAAFPADEIVFVAAAPSHRTWADRDIERRARDLFGVHCATVYGR